MMGRYESERCRHCEERQAYVEAIGDMTASMPVAMTDLGGRLDKEREQTPMSEKIETKPCKRCGDPKPIDDYRRTRNGGRANVCEQCRSQSASDTWKKKRALEGKAGTAGGNGDEALFEALFGAENDLHAGLLLLAKHKRRTPRDQLLYLVQTAIKEMER